MSMDPIWLEWSSNAFGEIWAKLCNVVPFHLLILLGILGFAVSWAVVWLMRKV